MPRYTIAKKCERFWHWLKQKVYGCKSFTKIEELIQQIRQLIWHFHERRTLSAINFNYDAYADLSSMFNEDCLSSKAKRKYPYKEEVLYTMPYRHILKTNPLLRAS